MKRKKGAVERGRYSYEGLHRTLHERARLGILTSLMARPDGLRFGDLKKLCALTDGNLSRHLDVLRESGLIEIRKKFENKRPQTLCRLTPEGREQFLDYVGELERVVRDAQVNSGAEARKIVSDVPDGWIPA